jgi:hypothetical protein
MTRDDIIRMAKEAGLYTKCEVHSAVPFDQLLTSFAALIAAAEREECAYIADQGFRRAAEGDEIADLIRARGQE